MGVQVLGAPVIIRARRTGSILAPSIFIDLEKGSRAISSG